VAGDEACPFLAGEAASGGGACVLLPRSGRGGPLEAAAIVVDHREHGAGWSERSVAPFTPISLQRCPLALHGRREPQRDSAVGAGRREPLERSSPPATASSSASSSASGNRRAGRAAFSRRRLPRAGLLASSSCSTAVYFPAPRDERSAPPGRMGPALGSARGRSGGRPMRGSCGGDTLTAANEVATGPRRGTFPPRNSACRPDCLTPSPARTRTRAIGGGRHARSTTRSPSQPACC
jgi:hypothetical protein